MAVYSPKNAHKVIKPDENIVCQQIYLSLIVSEDQIGVGSIEKKVLFVLKVNATRSRGASIRMQHADDRRPATGAVVSPAIAVLLSS